MPYEHSTASSTKRKASRRSKKAEPQCKLCGKKVGRNSDLNRHMKTHDPNAEKFPCPWEGCGYSTLQKGNLQTHYRRHIGDKSCVCIDDPDSECQFETCDPASLLRHRKNLHGYTPQARRKTGESSSNISSASTSSGILSSNSSPEMSQTWMTVTEILSLYEYHDKFIPSIDSFYSPSHLPIPGNPPTGISSLSDFFNFLTAEPDSTSTKQLTQY